MTFAEMLGAGRVTRPAISAHLDVLDKNERIAACVALSRDQQKRLWEIASSEPAEMQDIVGEKRFARHKGTVIGCNVHSLGWLTGPGYFTVTAGSNALLFDYRHVPDDEPDGWPRVANNDQGFAKPVYGGLLDDAVWGARDVLIGSARRGDVPLDSYFVLVRVTSR